MIEIAVERGHERTRLDSFLVSQFTQYSRAKIQRSILKGRVLVNGQPQKAAFKLTTGQVISFEPPPPDSDSTIPEDIPLHVLFEDEYLIGINKPPGMVVHPAKGHWSGTLTAALAFHFDRLSSVGGATRPGIVHRLDRDTSGIIVVAKTDDAHQKLAAQFEKRTVSKTYIAIVSPPPDRDRDRIDQPIGMHPYQREKMAIRKDHSTSRNASTFYEVLNRTGRFAKLRVSPKTGRTHQIRVHLAHIGTPVLADRLYSGRSEFRASELGSQLDSADAVVLDRQALHAYQITFKHPISNQPINLEAPLASDIEKCWARILQHHEQ